MARTSHPHVRTTSRTLSQNFLRSPAAAERFVRAARPHSDRPLLEVGAGEGALTALLARHCRELRAYEIDPRLLAALRARFASDTRVRVVGGDFLGVRPPHEPFAVAGNVPFSRTADIVDWCLRAPALTDATFITQLEYARKRTGDYGRWSRLTVCHWPRYEWRLVGRLRRYDFRPVPRVDAGILRIERRERPLLSGAEFAAFRGLVELGFTGVGGSLYASLRRARPARPLQAAFREAGIDRRALVGEVSPQQWLVVHRLI